MIHSWTGDKGEKQHSCSRYSYQIPCKFSNSNFFKCVRNKLYLSACLYLQVVKAKEGLHLLLFCKLSFLSVPSDGGLWAIQYINIYCSAIEKSLFVFPGALAPWNIMSSEYFTAQLLHYKFQLSSLYGSWTLLSSSGMLKCSHAFLGHIFRESHKVIFLLTRGYKHQCANRLQGQVSKFDQSEQTIFRIYCNEVCSYVELLFHCTVSQVLHRERLLLQKTKGCLLTQEELPYCCWSLWDCSSGQESVVLQSPSPVWDSFTARRTKTAPVLAADSLRMCGFK